MAGKLLLGKSPADFVDTLEVKNFVEIALSGTFSKIYLILHFTQKFKMAAKNGRKRFLQKDSADTLCTKHLKKLLILFLRY